MRVLSSPVQDGRQLVAALWGWIKSYPYTVPAVGLFVGLAHPFLFREFSEWEDVYLRAASNFRSGASIYRFGEGYVYPPFMAMMAVPFTLLPPLMERLAWYLVSAASLVMLCWWAWRLTGGGPVQGRDATLREHLIWVLGLACGFRYALDCLAHQQTDLLIGALTMAGCMALSRGRFWPAATWFGLAAGAKCTPLLWCGYLVWRGQWKPALWLLGVALGVNLLPNLVCAPPTGNLWLLEWLHSCLLPMTGVGRYLGNWYSDPLYNQSICGALLRWFTTRWSWTEAGIIVTDRTNPISPLVLKFLVLVIDLLLVAGVLAALKRGRRAATTIEASTHPPRPSGDYCLVLLLMVLFSPMSSKPHFCTLLLPGFYLARWAMAERNGWVGVALAASITAGCLGFRDVWGANTAMVALWWGNVTWSALFLLAACGYAVAQPAFGKQAAIAIRLKGQRLAG
jgi:hypothetical protein